MDSENSTPTGGSAKKRRLGSGQSPLVDLELDAKNYEIRKLKELVQTLHEKSSKMEEEIKTPKSKTPKSANEPGLRYVTLKEIINGDRVNTDLLSPEHLEAIEDGLWNIFSTETTAEPFKMDIDDIYDKTQFKIDLTGSLTCIDEENPSRIYEIIKCLYTCNHENLTLSYQNIDELAFAKLTPVSVKSCQLKNIWVEKFTGGFLAADEIFEKLPNVEEFEYYCKRYNHESTQNVPANLSNFPRFENLKKFKICNVTKKFDLLTFGKFMDKHPDTSFVIQYHPLCESTQLKIQGVTEKLAETCKISVEFAN
uniref:DUF38 domain-containing protein n=1 Tax=Panagrolaimus davidi TaxID=227884 RepID=A0A914PRD2_9BILA